jgi:KH domain
LVLAGAPAALRAAAARARGGGEDKGRWFALSMCSVTAEPGDQGAGLRRREGNGVTDDSAFKKQVRARMAETGQKYTEARREVVAQADPGQSPVLRVHVDIELTAAQGRAYAAADQQGRRELTARLLADQLKAAGPAPAAAASEIMTSQELVAGPEAAQDALIREAVQRGVDRAVGVSAVDIGRAADRLQVSIRAARPILLAGPRGDEADRLRGELEELTGQRVRLNIWEG